MKHNANGLSYTKLYRTYSNMLKRTTNKNFPTYKYYGGKGIKICDEWLNDFTKFYDWAMSNGYKEGLSIDRINVNGNYEPSNCRWVDINTQNNNRNDNHYIEYKNIKYTISQLAKKFDIDRNVLNKRIRRGWELEKALKTKVRNVKH